MPDDGSLDWNHVALDDKHSSVVFDCNTSFALSIHVYCITESSLYGDHLYIYNEFYSAMVCW